MNFIKTNTKELILLIVYPMFALLQIGIFILFGISLLTNSNLVESEFALNSISLTIPTILGVIFFRKEIIQSFTYFKEKTILKIVSIPMVVLFTVIVEQAVLRFLATGQPENQEQVLTQGAEMPIIFTLLLFGIMGPIIEEIMFRHILLNRFSHYVGTTIASIISIIIFTVLHANQLADIAIYLPGAVILTAAYLISNRSLAYVIAIHMLNNCLSFIL
ncbi:CPBP family intramembrane metalloprotease [Bacillus cereus]|nr:CPBP family intramembrane metalloprotease [Bacillus cereus]